MPRISITEKDLSWYSRQRAVGPLVVAMPIIASWGPENAPTLVDEVNFVSTFGDKEIDATKDISYCQAASFINTGIGVLAFRVKCTGATAAKSTSSANNYTKVESSSAATTPKGIVWDDSGTTITGTLEAGASVAENIYLVPSTEEDKSDAYVSKLKGDSYEWSYYGRVDTAESTFPTNGLGVIVSAKYLGSYGNNLVVSTKGSGKSRTFIVTSKSTGAILESLVFNFDTPSSPYWYEVSSQQSKYIKVECETDLVTTQGVLSATPARNLSDMQLGRVDYTNGVNVAVEGIDCTSGHSAYDMAQNAISTDEETKKALLSLSDNLMYDFDVLVSGGFDLTFTATSEDLAKEIVETRKTSIYLYDSAKANTPANIYSDCSKYNSSFVASYGPWCSARVISDGSTRDLPGSYVLLIAWGRAIANGANLWEAPAGVKRASVGSIVRDTVVPVTSAIVDSWQSDDLEYKVNPIVMLKQYGYVIYGNSTLLHKDYAGGTSMLNAFSTRVVSNLVKREAINTALGLQFDQMSNDLFTEFRTLLGSYMDALRYSNALYDYQILLDTARLNLDNLNTRTLPVIIRISPNPAVENFDITLEISQAGVTFGDDSTTPYSQVNENIM